MFSTCGIIARGYKNCELSNACPQPKKDSSNPWKIVFGLEDPGLGSQIQHVKNCKPEGYRGGPESTQIDDGGLLGLTSTLKHIMKQISNIKKKFTQGKKSGEFIGGKQQQHNGQQHKKKPKKSLAKKSATTETQVKNRLNVNERPVRKKKKTKKYESYERNGKSPEPEIKHETNLLLALGLTPVKKNVENDGKTK